MGAAGGMVIAMDAPGREVRRQKWGGVIHIPSTVANVHRDDAPEALAVDSGGQGPVDGAHRTGSTAGRSFIRVIRRQSRGRVYPEPTRAACVGIDPAL